MIKPFYTYVRRTYYMSGTVLGTEDKIMNKTEKKTLLSLMEVILYLLDKFGQIIIPKHISNRVT